METRSQPARTRADEPRATAAPASAFAFASTSTATGLPIVEEIPYVRALMRRLAPAHADDLVQETMARALRYAETFDRQRALRPWLLRVAYRVFLDHAETEQRSPRGALAAEDVAQPAPDRIAALASAEDLRRALGSLRDVERRVLLAFHADGRDIAGIAAELGLPEGTVKSHLHRARRKVARVAGAEPGERGDPHDPGEGGRR